MEAKKRNQSHVLAAPFFLKGHEIPLLHLCRHLVANADDCIVTLLQVPGNNTSTLESSPSITVSDLPFAPFRLGERKIENFRPYFEAFNNLGDQVVAEWKNKGVTCVIGDVLVGWGKSVADGLSVPWIPFWTSTATELAVYFNIPRIVASAVDTSAGISIPGLPQIKPSEYPTISHFNSDFPFKFILEAFVHRVGLITQAERVFVNSTLALEEGAIESLRDSGANVLPVGPLHLLSTAKDEDPNEVLPWLDQQEPLSVLYIAFGTTVNVPAEQIQQMASALESSNVPFLWVVRSEHVQLIPPDFTSTARYSLRSKDGNSGDERCRGLLSDWVPQTKVLQHSAVRGFFTHCGWNSVLESVTAGVPMITRPFIADQVLTSKLLSEQWGISVRIGKVGHEVVVDKAEIEAAIEELKVNGDELRTKAGELRAAARKAMDDGGSSFTNLDSFVKDLNLIDLPVRTSCLRFPRDFSVLSQQGIPHELLAGL